MAYASLVNDPIAPRGIASLCASRALLPRRANCIERAQPSSKARDSARDLHSGTSSYVLGFMTDNGGRAGTMIAVDSCGKPPAPSSGSCSLCAPSFATC